MKRNTFFIGDTHWGHENILKFQPKERPFDTIQEHDEFLVRVWNETVNPGDKVFLVGDVAFRSRYDYLGRLNGSIIVVLGNHDYPAKVPLILEHEHVKVCGSAEYGGGIITHIPVHPSQLEERWKFNIHGHLHANSIDDPRYFCASVEQTNLRPMLWEDIRRILKVK